MSTRADYRSDLKDKLVGLEDSGYGDFEYTDSELNTYLELAVTRLFPALYRRVVQSDLTVTTYGTNGYGYVEPTLPDRVYLVEDADEFEPIYQWEFRSTRVQKIDSRVHPSVNVHYYDAYSLPGDDGSDAGIPAIWTPLIVLGALIEALEARQDSGVRGDDPPVGQLHEVPLLDRLVSRYETTKAEMAMSLPAVMV